ncbi:MAG: hypothetical protein E2O85_05830 [Bacteroidetes bacterium]|nr:MAG: hypothetical protein E2O85_05830 [Bacteroidota bacterium]
MTRLLLLLGCALTLISCSRPNAEFVSLGLENPSWEIQYSDSTALFIGISVVNESTVWVSGSGGRVVRTTDGGSNWIAGVVPGADSLQFRDIHAFDSNTAFVLSIGSGTDSRIYRTDDGGETWTMVFQNQDPNGFFDCFSFWDLETGFAVSDSHENEFHLIQTVDGGSTWTRIDPALVPDARDGEGAFAASGTCVVTRPGGLGWFSTGASSVDTRVIRTTDYGQTWSESPTPIRSDSPTSGIFTLSFLDDSHGIAMGGEYSASDTLVLNVAITENGGETWTAAGQSNLTGSVYGASFVPNAPTPTVVGVAPTGTDYSTDNGMTWTRIDSSSYWSVAFVHADAGWAVGPKNIAKIQNDRTAQ